MKNFYKICIVLGIALLAGCGEEDISLPKVITGDNTVYDESMSVSCNGFVEKDGGSSVYSRGICYIKGAGAPTIADMTVPGGSGKGSYSCAINVNDTGIYSYCAYASNTVGTAYGEVKTFYVGDNPLEDNSWPSVSTGNATINNSEHTVTCNGTIIDVGAGTLLQAGICYLSGTGNPTIANTHQSVSNAAGLTSGSHFSVQLTELGYGQYSYRAYATNEYGTTYGETKTFNMSMPENSVVITFDGTTWVDNEPFLDIRPEYGHYEFNEPDSSYLSYAYEYWLQSYNHSTSTELQVDFFPLIVRTYDGDWNYFGNNGYIEYDAGEDLIHEWNDINPNFYIGYGSSSVNLYEDEWLAKSFHISITRFDPVAHIVSMTLEAVMFNRNQALANGVEAAETKNLTVTANNISFEWWD